VAARWPRWWHRPRVSCADGCAMAAGIRVPRAGGVALAGSAPDAPSHHAALPPLQADRIKHLLDNVESSSKSAVSIAEKTEGMKYLLAVRNTHTTVQTRRRRPTAPHHPRHIVPLVLCSCYPGLQMMAKGRDVSEFYPDVVRNVIVKAVEVKKLIYTYLVHHAVSGERRMHACAEETAGRRGRGRQGGWLLVQLLTAHARRRSDAHGGAAC